VATPITDADAPAKWSGERSEVVHRLLRDTCELCDSQDRINVHHLRKLADLKRRGQGDPPRWVKVMAARQRKTLVVCHACHQAIHAGRVDAPTALRKRNSTLESRVR
jgi:hypothetical protein